MTPSQLAFHEAHKARMARFAAAAERHVGNVRAASALAVAFKEPDPISEPEAKAASEPRPSTRYWFRIVGLTSPTIKDIQLAVCDYYGTSMNDLISHRLTHPITLHRQYAMYLAKEMTQQSMPRIGRQFGGRDHTTVLYAVNKVARLLASNEGLQQEFDAIRKLLEGFDATATEDCDDAKGAVGYKAEITPPGGSSARSGLAHAQAASPREPGGPA